MLMVLAVLKISAVEVSTFSEQNDFTQHTIREPGRLKVSSQLNVLLCEEMEVKFVRLPAGKLNAEKFPL